MKNTIKLLIIFLFVGCGSGTFENDPKTWNKVFGENIPKEIKVINSRFWKSAHWTYEYEVYFEFKTDKQFLQEYFIKRYELIKYKENRKGIYFGEKPLWFKTDTIEDFNVWIHPEKYNNMKLLKNKETGKIYFYFSQF